MCDKQKLHEEKKGTRLELVNKNVLINVSKSVFTQVSYQPSLKPESLHAVFYFLFVFTLEHPNRVMNDLLMLDHWSKKAENLLWSAMRTISLQCISCAATSENSTTAVSWSVMPLNLLNVITLIWIRCQLALLKLLYHFPSCDWRSVYEPIWLIVSSNCVTHGVNM